MTDIDMTFETRLAYVKRDSYEEGLEDGRAEGREEGRAEERLRAEAAEAKVAALQKELDQLKKQLFGN